MTRVRLGWLNGRTADRGTLCTELDRALLDGRPWSVGFVNPHVFVTAEHEPVVRTFLAGCDRICIDGVGIAIAHRLFGRARLPRVVAEQLFRAHWTGSAVRADALLIGIDGGALERAAAALNAASDRLHVSAALHGFADDARVATFLQAWPDVRFVLIGAGSPRSEAIALQVRRLRAEAVIVHCGAGTLKTWAGSKRRAPAWLSRLGLEWAHRLVFEPHARARYLRGAPLFAAALWRARCSSFDPGSRFS